MAITIHEADVLVCGCGLAGMRAALSAARAATGGPAPVVVQLGCSSGPTGSSFANENNALGILAPQTPYHAELLERRIVEIAGVAYLDRELVRTLLEEGPARVRDMEMLDITFRPERHAACFYPEAQVARVVDGLAAMHARFSGACDAAGVRRLDNMTVVGILRDAAQDDRVCGAVAEDAAGERHVFVAPAVVMALGGPAPLFARHVSGRAATGLGYGLMRSVGVHLGNTSFLQFMWYGGAPRRFVSVAQACGTGRCADTLDAPLLQARATHCPYAWHQPDNAVDHALLVCPDLLEDGQLHLYAHAGNGGAVVDVRARTNVSGLFACGECATGMHGANRIGGAMVLATQVFGHRAGEAAAELSQGGGTLVGRRRMMKPDGPYGEWCDMMRLDGGVPDPVPLPLPLVDTPDSADILAELPRLLERACVPSGGGGQDEGGCGNPAAEGLEAALQLALAEQPLSPVGRLQLLTALELVQHRLRVPVACPS